MTKHSARSCTLLSTLFVLWLAAAQPQPPKPEPDDPPVIVGPKGDDSPADTGE